MTVALPKTASPGNGKRWAGIGGVSQKWKPSSFCGSRQECPATVIRDARRRFWSSDGQRELVCVN
jgi:hypothetical protein